VITLFVITTSLILLYEGVPLIKKKLWRELSVLGVLLGSATYLAIAGMLQLSTPLNWLEYLLGPFGKMFFR